MSQISAVIQTKKEVATGTLLVDFDLQEKTVSFRAGQYFYVTLPSGLEHHFTIVNSPSRQGIISMITRIRDSAFKQELKKLPVGGKVKIGKIEGEFTLPRSTDKPLVFIALGIGITPYLSMLDYIQEKKLKHKITLFYSDSNVASMVFKTKLEKLAKTIKNFKLVLTITKDKNWKGESSRINSQLLQKYLEQPADYVYYIAGPPGAVTAVTGEVEKLKVPVKNIITENFSGYETSPKKSLSTIISQAVQYPIRLVEGRLGGKKLSQNQVQTGSGAVIEKNGHQVAVYKNEQGKVISLSPVCTHLGCIVGWNGKEKTWDCPCHGSRYTKEGKVIQGPAKRDLDKLS